MSAAERREDILVAAMEEFAIGGLHGTSTESIARRVGVSQPYLFRLYGTKMDLFLAVANRAFDDVEHLFLAASRGGDGSQGQLESMGMAYGNLLANRSALMLQLQLYAACEDLQVREVVSSRYARLYRLVQQLSGATPEEAREFFASGMLLNVVAAMGVAADLGEEEWLAACLAKIQ